MKTFDATVKRSDGRSVTVRMDELLETLAFFRDYFRGGLKVYPDSMVNEDESIKERVARLLDKAGWPDMERAEDAES